MKLTRILTAAILAGVALSASAQDTGIDAARLAVNATVRVQSPDACPRDYFLGSQYYSLKNGHLVQDGWVCQSLFEMSK